MSAKVIVIIVVVALVVGAAAGFGGYSYGVQAGLQQAQNIRNTFLAERGLGGNGGQGGAGGQGGFAAGAQGTGGNRQFNPNNFAAGQVKTISGNTIELSTAQTVVKVQLTDQTQIQKQASGTVSDIQPGERITVQGNRASDGTMTAQAIQIGGNRGAGGGQSGQGAGRPSGTPQAQSQ